MTLPDNQATRELALYARNLVDLYQQGRGRRSTEEENMTRSSIIALHRPQRVLRGGCMATIRTQIFEHHYSVSIDGRRVPVSFDRPGYSVAVYSDEGFGMHCSHADFLSRAEAEAALAKAAA